MILVNWCGFYYNNFVVVSEDDRPPEDIYDKDALLDQWIDERRHQQKNKNKSSIKAANSHGEWFEVG